MLKKNKYRIDIFNFQWHDNAIARGLDTICVVLRWVNEAVTDGTNRQRLVYRYEGSVSNKPMPTQAKHPKKKYAIKVKVISVFCHETPSQQSDTSGIPIHNLILNLKTKT